MSKPRRQLAGRITKENPSGLIVLAVDDEPIVLRAVTAALAFAGFGVVVASNGVDGLDTFSRSRDAIDLVLADIAMPVLGGIEMSDRIRKIRPDVPILLMTGYSDVVISAFAKIRYPLIQKPFLLEDLIRTVRANIHRRTREGSSEIRPA